MDSYFLQRYTHTLVVVGEQEYSSLNYIPTSCASFLILVTFLNLALIYGRIPVKNKSTHPELQVLVVQGCDVFSYLQERF